MYMYIVERTFLSPCWEGPPSWALGVRGHWSTIFTRLPNNTRKTEYIFNSSLSFLGLSQMSSWYVWHCNSLLWWCRGIGRSISTTPTFITTDTLVLKLIYWLIQMVRTLWRWPGGIFTTITPKEITPMGYKKGSNLDILENYKLFEGHHITICSYSHALPSSRRSLSWQIPCTFRAKHNL